MAFLIRMGLLLIFLFATSTFSQVEKRQVIFPKDDDDTELPNPNQEVKNQCITPRGVNGDCVSIVLCPELNRNPDFSFLRQSICGFLGDEPQVCCPLSRSQVISSSTTTTTTTRRPTTRNPRTRPPPPSPTPSPPVRRTSSSPDTQGKRPVDLPTECGQNNVSTTRIVGGREAEPGSWPWIVALYIEENGVRSAQCGAALVTHRHVITAAHCVTDGSGNVLPPSTFTVRLAEHNLNRNDDGVEHVDFPVEKVIRHEKFEPRTFKNDIAVLKITGSAVFRRHIQPICLPYGNISTANLEDREAFVAGWGTTAFNGPSSEVLREVKIRIWEQETCRRAYQRDLPLTQEYFCAGFADGGKDACQGDSGGPFMLSENNKFYLIGIVSFGKRCAQPGFPGVYTNVRLYLDWMADNMS